MEVAVDRGDGIGRTGGCRGSLFARQENTENDERTRRDGFGRHFHFITLFPLRGPREDNVTWRYLSSGRVGSKQEGKVSWRGEKHGEADNGRSKVNFAGAALRWGTATGDDDVDES